MRSEQDEHEKEREELKEKFRTVEEERSAIESVDDISSEKTEALTASNEEFIKRIVAFQKRAAEIEQVTATLEEASHKLLERVIEVESQVKDASVEYEKMMFEVFKLVATLDTGVLIAMTAIAIGPILNPGSLKLFFASCLLVFLSVVCSVAACLAQALLVKEALYPTGRSTFSGWSLMNFFFWGSVMGSILGLGFGIALFLQFVLNNLN